MEPDVTLPAINKDIKFIIHSAFQDLGGIQRLVSWANDEDHPENLGDFYTKFWTKIIPREVKAEHTGKDGGPIIVCWEGSEAIQIPSQPAGQVAISDCEEAEYVESGP
jgi:hypothetical protein